jgi:hypothetical protein
MQYRSILLVSIFVLYSIPNSFALFHSRSGGMPGGGGAVTNVTGVQITNEKRSSGASVGTVIGDLSATITGGGPCTTCTYSMVSSGASSDGPTPVSCTASSNIAQIGTDPGNSLPAVEVPNGSLTKQIYGAHPAP